MTADVPLGFPYVALLRAARRRADLSQRQLAERAGVNRAVIGHIEAGRRVPSVLTYARLLTACDCELLALWSGGRERFSFLVGMPEQAMRDAANRYFPAHLDVRPTRGAGSIMWWYWWYRHPKPLATFRVRRDRRDEERETHGLGPDFIDKRAWLARAYPGRRSRDPRARDDEWFW